MSLSPGGAKQKGAEGERELARLLIGWAGPKQALELTRNLEQTRSGGHDLVGLEGYGMAVEVKRVETKSIAEWWRQAVRQAEKAGNLIPVLAWRQNRQPWRFRIRVWCYPCKDQLDIDLEGEEFKKWFLAQIASR